MILLILLIIIQTNAFSHLFLGFRIRRCLSSSEICLEKNNNTCTDNLRLCNLYNQSKFVQQLYSCVRFLNFMLSLFASSLPESAPKVLCCFCSCPKIVLWILCANDDGYILIEPTFNP
jgi:hypothetical protein